MGNGTSASQYESEFYLHTQTQSHMSKIQHRTLFVHTCWVELWGPSSGFVSYYLIMRNNQHPPALG